jgi:hypothetical protein
MLLISDLAPHPRTGYRESPGGGIEHRGFERFVAVRAWINSCSDCRNVR